MIEPPVQQLATAQNYAALAFHLPDGSIANHVMWVDATEEHILINTEVHRLKYRAISANPQVTVTIWDAASPYRYAEVRGRVAGEVRGPDARAHIDALAQHYEGEPYDDRDYCGVTVLFEIERWYTWGHPAGQGA